MKYTKKLTLLQEAEVCRRYALGESSVRLARDFGVRQPTIKRLLLARGVTFKSRLTEVQKAKVCELYQLGLTSGEVGEKFGLSRNAVLAILEKESIGRRDPSEARNNRFTKYYCDASFFENIDSEEKAYWLGFIVADGNVYKNSFSLALASVDRAHILRLRSALKSTHPIKEVTSPAHFSQVIGHVRETECCRFVVTSPRLTESLRRLGVVDNKSLIVKWPEIATHLEKHFLRGVVDGDGCFSLGKTGDMSFSIAGSESIVRTAEEVLAKRCGINRHKVRKIRNHYLVQLCGNKQIGKIASFLYEDASIYLPRKYDKVKHLMALGV